MHSCSNSRYCQLLPIFCWFSFLFWPLSIIATDADMEESDEESAQKPDGEDL